MEQEIWYFEPDYYSFYNLIHNLFKPMYPACIWSEEELARFIKKVVEP
jgi:hypothetical protein